MAVPAVAAGAASHGVMGTFTQKLGPLPVWAWAAIALAVVVGYMYYAKVGIFGATANSAASAAAPTSGGNPATATDTSGLTQGSSGIVSDMEAWPTGSGPGSTSGAAGSTPYTTPPPPSAPSVAPPNVFPGRASATPSGNGVISNAGGAQSGPGGRAAFLG